MAKSSGSALGFMNERDWELYRLSVAESMPDSPYKKAVIDGIRNKLEVLEGDASSKDRGGGVNWQSLR